MLIQIQNIKVSVNIKDKTQQQSIANKMRSQVQVQSSWFVSPDNSILSYYPSPTQQQNIYSFCCSYNDFLPEFVQICMEMTKTIKAQQISIIETTEDLSMLVEVVKMQRSLFIDTGSELSNSYKGFVTWVLIATKEHAYLVDMIKLHDYFEGFKQALERKQLVKFTHCCQQLLFSLKRDFSIFMPNIFDLQVIYRYMNKQGKLSHCPKTHLRIFLQSLSSSQNTCRPFKQSLLCQIQYYYQQELLLMANLDKFFEKHDPQYMCYAYFNHMEFLLKQYQHSVLKASQLKQVFNIKHGHNLTSFQQQFHSTQIHQASQINYDSNINNQSYNPYNKSYNHHKESFNPCHKDHEQQQKCQLLIQWRQHIAKLHDVSSEQILPYSTIRQLCKDPIHSILQISQIYNCHGTSLYCLHIEQFEQIFELFELYKENKQEVMHVLNIPKKNPYFKGQQRPIRELFKEIGLSDNQDWLNRKDDKSVKMYKEILSIFQFDNSIIQEYQNEKPIHNNSLHNINETVNMNKYIKYAQFLRNGNHRRLQQYYQQQQRRQKNNKCYSDKQQNWINQQQMYGNQGWDYIEKELNIPTMDTIDEVKSSSSIFSFRSYSELDSHSCMSIQIPHSDNFLKQNNMISLNQLDSPGYMKRVEPLPENIQKIYLEAAQTKKNNTNNQKKKCSKKQLKANVQDKQQQFVPKKEELFNLFHY